MSASAAVIVLALWLRGPMLVAAHDGVPDLGVAPRDVAAGSGVTVVGDDFVTGETISLVLVGNGARTELASLAVGRNGHFSADVVVPAAVPDGRYSVEADRPSGPVAAAGLTVGGSAGDVPGPGLVGIVVLAVVAGAGAGLILARRSRAAGPGVDATGGDSVGSG